MRTRRHVNAPCASRRGHTAPVSSGAHGGGGYSIPVRLCAHNTAPVSRYSHKVRPSAGQAVRNRCATPVTGSVFKLILTVKDLCECDYRSVEGGGLFAAAVTRPRGDPSSWLNQHSTGLRWRWIPVSQARRPGASPATTTMVHSLVASFQDGVVDAAPTEGARIHA
jgi:hypothetical protein